MAGPNCNKTLEFLSCGKATGSMLVSFCESDQILRNLTRRPLFALRTAGLMHITRFHSFAARDRIPFEYGKSVGRAPQCLYITVIDAKSHPITCHKAPLPLSLG